MRKLVVFFVIAWAEASIMCPLVSSRMDGLLTVPVAQPDGSYLHLIVDTGAAGPIFFGPAAPVGPSLASIEYQQGEIGSVRPHILAGSGLSLACDLRLAIPNAVIGEPTPLDLRDVADGILGLGGPGFGERSSFLYSNKAVPWSSVGITIPSAMTGPALHFRKQNLRTTVSQSVPVVSDYYWAADLNAIRVGDQPIQGLSDMVVVFDTGSNFFGLSPPLLDKLREAVVKSGCVKPISITLQSNINMSFGPEQYTIERNCNDLAMAAIDRSRLGDLSHKNVLIVGTRGLEGKNLNLHRQSSTSKLGRESRLSFL
jgi:hypothetical protein